MPEFRLLEVADEHVELALVEVATDDYELRLRVMVGYLFSVFPVRRAGLFAIRLRARALQRFLEFLAAGRRSRHGRVCAEHGTTLSVMPGPASARVRDVIVHDRLLGLPAPPVRTTLAGSVLDRLLALQLPGGVAKER